MTQGTTTVQGHDRRWNPSGRMSAVALAAVAALAVTFWLGVQSGGRTHATTAYCLSASGQIDCTENLDGTGRGFFIPRDVAWSDESGAQRDGRPACLPPVGIGNIFATFMYETVDVNGYQQNVAVWVDCAATRPVS